MSSDIPAQKKQIRKDILLARRSMEKLARLHAENAIVKAVFGNPRYQQCDILLVYASYGDEVNTFPIITNALADGKSVYLPRVDLTKGERYMDFYEIHSVDELMPGYKGIPEPLQADTIFDAMRDENVLMLVPGVAFDKQKNRLGYGKGFYDSYLERFPSLVDRTIGICFACQMLETLPCQQTDCKLAEIICE